MPTAGLANDIEVKFQSAVELVRSLPQKGSFQPSYSDASKVYGYYKQANFGPCNHARPAFWDVVGRAKWDAWNVLGNMPKDEAMENYVNEIKKLFERLTTMEEFQEAQTNFSHVIIPFCESNGLDVPNALVEFKKAEKKKKEKKKMEDALQKANGIANGHLIQSEEKNENAIADSVARNNDRLTSSNLEAESAVEKFDVNGSMEHHTGNDTHGNSDGDDGINSIQPTNGERVNLPSEAVILQMSSYIDAESSDDDVYCDSFNPDQISSPTLPNTTAIDESNLQRNPGHELINSADEACLLIEDENEIGDENGLVLKNSTPVVKMRPNRKEDLLIDSNNSGKGENTDLSTLSSLSGDFNGRSNVSHSVPKTDGVGLEAELKYEFESKSSKHGRKSRNRNRTRSRNEYKQHEGFGIRDLVVGARGNSQTDLAGSANESRERSESRDAQQRGAESSRPIAGESSTRPRRTKADSSSDSNHSTRSSVASGETIGEQIVKALGRLEHDMRLVLRRLDSIENRITDVSHAVNRRPWWTAYLPSRRFMFLFLWPVLIHILFALWRRRRRRK